MPGPSWKDLDDRRAALRKPMSRAEWARLAGVSESTITKGLKDGSRPRKALRNQAEMILNAAEIAAEEVNGKMDELRGALERRL